MPEPSWRPALPDDLDATLAEAWRLIAGGVTDRRSGFHTIVAATIGLDGRPRARTVVSRGFDPATGILRFHTDARAAKIAELQRDPRVALHAYDPARKVQIRIEGIAGIHAAGALADSAWANSRVFSRVCYGISPGPGTPIDAADGFVLPGDEAQIAAGRADFRAVMVTAFSLEWLFLAHSGHRRALFERATIQDAWKGRWLAP